MNVLFVYPEYPDTFWSFKYVLKFVSKKAAFPPLGLLTVAAMLPEKWQKKLVDLNVESLGDEHLAWADILQEMNACDGSFYSRWGILRRVARNLLRRRRPL